METSDACEVCKRKKPTTGLNLVGQNGAERIALCEDCGKKARNRDADVWEKIREILRNRD